MLVYACTPPCLAPCTECMACVRPVWSTLLDAHDMALGHTSTHTIPRRQGLMRRAQCCPPSPRLSSSPPSCAPCSQPSCPPLAHPPICPPLGGVGLGGPGWPRWRRWQHLTGPCMGLRCPVSPCSAPSYSPARLPITILCPWLRGCGLEVEHTLGPVESHVLQALLEQKCVDTRLIPLPLIAAVGCTAYRGCQCVDVWPA